MASNKKIPPILLENVSLIFRNFSGRETKFQPAGTISFSVILTDELAEQLSEMGMNVKWTKPRDEEDIPVPFLGVKVNYDSPRPPKIVLIAGGRRTYLTRDTIQTLDYADIINVDLMLNPYAWESPSGSGVSAYLDKAYVTIEDDPLERKYAENASEHSLEDE